MPSFKHGGNNHLVLCLLYMSSPRQSMLGNPQHHNSPHSLTWCWFFHILLYNNIEEVIRDLRARTITQHQTVWVSGVSCTWTVSLVACTWVYHLSYNRNEFMAAVFLTNNPSQKGSLYSLCVCVSEFVFVCLCVCEVIVVSDALHTLQFYLPNFTWGSLLSPKEMSWSGGMSRSVPVQCARVTV